MHESIKLRPLTAHDEAFLFRVVASVHEESFASLDVSAEQKNQLVRMQIEAQQQQYRDRFPNADFDVVMCERKPAGTMYALRGPDQFVLIDIALLPEYRNQGIGTQLVTVLIDQARQSDRTLDAHVRLANPAWHLWKRLGFEQVNDDGVYRQIRVPRTDKPCR